MYIIKKGLVAGKRFRLVTFLLITLLLVGFGFSPTMAATTDEEASQSNLWGWGRNSDGQLGDGSISSARYEPVNIGMDKYWVTVSASSHHSAAIDSQGFLWAWGRNNYGQLGDGSTIDKRTPVQIGSSKQWKYVSAGLNHTVAIKEDGSLWAWGRNSNGQLGNGSRIDESIPVQISSENKWKSVSAGDLHTVAIEKDGTLWTWGRNSNGQLGINSNINSDLPVLVGSEQDEWASISAGASHTLALMNNGSLWAWGLNGFGELGDGSTTSRSTPVQVGGDHDWISVSAGSYRSAALKEEGTLWTWGDNNNIPIKVGSNNWVSVSAGGSFTAAIKADGTLWAWGYNNNGQLGDGTQNTSDEPMQVGKDKIWSDVFTGLEHTFALTYEHEQSVSLIAIVSIEDILVQYGTPLDSVGLPGTVGVSLSNGTTNDVAVIWDQGNPDYNESSAGIYEFTGIPTMPYGVSNVNNIKASVRVIVYSEDNAEIQKVYGIGYWKNNPDKWPQGNYSSFYNGPSWVEIMATPPKQGNAYIILAHQYIATSLNVANGCIMPANVQQAYVNSTDYYNGTGTTRGELLEWARILDLWNNGILSEDE